VCLKCYVGSRKDHISVATAAYLQLPASTETWSGDRPSPFLEFARLPLPLDSCYSGQVNFVPQFVFHLSTLRFRLLHERFPTSLNFPLSLLSFPQQSTLFALLRPVSTALRVSAAFVDATHESRQSACPQSILPPTQLSERPSPQSGARRAFISVSPYFHMQTFFIGPTGTLQLIKPGPLRNNPVKVHSHLLPCN
jgi:hypothetical protein